MTVVEKSVETTGSRISSLEIGLTEFRTEVREEFAAVRAELAQVQTSLNAKIDSLSLRQDSLAARMDAVQISLSKEIQENRRLTLALHEELLSRLKLLGEASPPAKN